MTDVSFLARTARREYDELLALGRRTVAQAWQLGHTLTALKAACQHGQWLPTLDAYGIPERTAQRLIALRARYDESDKLTDFGSVAEALRPPALAEPDDESPLQSEHEPTLAAQVLLWHIHDAVRHINAVGRDDSRATCDRFKHLSPDDAESNAVAVDLSIVASNLLRKMHAAHGLDATVRHQVIAGEIAKAEGRVNMIIEGFEAIETDHTSYGTRVYETPPREWCDLYRRSAFLPA